jgi:hypothetical protein
MCEGAWDAEHTFNVDNMVSYTLRCKIHKRRNHGCLHSSFLRIVPCSFVTCELCLNLFVVVCLFFVCCLLFFVCCLTAFFDMITTLSLFYERTGMRAITTGMND